jgi:hypothetical protein
MNKEVAKIIGEKEERRKSLDKLIHLQQETIKLIILSGK